MKKNLYFFVSLVFALSAVCSCSNDDDDSAANGYNCLISFMQGDKVSVKIINTPSNFNPAATNEDGDAVPGQGDLLYFFANDLGGEEQLRSRWVQSEPVTLRITSYKLINDDHVQLFDNNSNQKSYKEYWCTVEPY